MKLNFISQRVTALNFHPPISGITAFEIMPGGTLHYIFLLQAFDPNEWCLKNGLLGGGLNP